MSRSDPDLKDVMRAIEDLNRSFEGPKKQFEESGRLSSPEHIAEIAGLCESLICGADRDKAGGSETGKSAAVDFNLAAFFASP